MNKIKTFTLKEKDVWLPKQDGRFFNDEAYKKERKIFMEEANTKVMDWYIVGMSKTKVKVSLVNYERQD